MWFCTHRGWSFVLVCAALALIGCWNTVWIGHSAQWDFVGTFALNCVIVAIIGSAVNGCAYGVLVDNRNKVSLSKSQAALWTLLVLSAIVTAAGVNLKVGAQDILGFDIPGQLLIAMGLSAGSLVATPALLRRCCWLRLTGPPSGRHWESSPRSEGFRLCRTISFG
jgi:hypothetical protein